MIIRPIEDVHFEVASVDRLQHLIATLPSSPGSPFVRPPEFLDDSEVVPNGSASTAIESIRLCVELDAAYAEAWANLGDCLVTDGDIDAGVDAMQRAVDLDPSDAEYRFNLADTLERSGCGTCCGALRSVPTTRLP